MTPLLPSLQRSLCRRECSRSLLREGLRDNIDNGGCACRDRLLGGGHLRRGLIQQLNNRLVLGSTCGKGGDHCSLFSLMNVYRKIHQEIQVGAEQSSS